MTSLPVFLSFSRSYVNRVPSSYPLDSHPIYRNIPDKTAHAGRL